VTCTDKQHSTNSQQDISITWK